MRLQIRFVQNDCHSRYSRNNAVYFASALLRVNMKRWFLILFTVATLAVAKTAGAQDAPDPYLTRVSARHVAGAGVGHTSGYSSLDWFLPLSAESDSTMWFGDFRGLIFNDAEFGSNVGTGYRWFVEDQNRIYGINGYWDTRNNNMLLFNQAGIGVESLGQIFDFRANAYTPAVNDTYQHQPWNAYFLGNGLILPSTAALSGVDTETGVNFPAFYQISTSVFGGGYYYDSNHTIAATGWRVRAQAAWRDSVVVGVSVQDDELFGQTVNGMIELRQTVFHRTTLARRSMRHKFRQADGSGDGETVRHRLADPVYRRQNIVLQDESSRLTTPGGTPLNFLHVVPGGGAGSGTFEDPYSTISGAMADLLSATGIVYTPSGGTFAEPVTMTAGSSLFSNGPTQFVSTNFGSVKVPLSGVNSSLTALPSKIVGNIGLAHNTVLNGFDVQGRISGTNVTGVSLVNNRIASSPLDAIILTSSTGVNMNNLLITNPIERGILLNDSSASLSSVTIQNSGLTALEINTAAMNRTVTATGLNIVGSLSGIDANVIGAGNLLLNISGTPGSATASNSISVQQDAVNVSTGAVSAGKATVQLNSLTVASTAGFGIVVDGSAGTGITTVTGFSGNSVTKAAMGGALFDTVTFDSNLITPGIQPVSAGTLTIGAMPGDVAGAGVSIQDSVGNLNLGVAKIFNNNGAGLFVATSPTLTVSSTSGSTMETQLGPVLDLSNTKTALNFTSLKSQNSPGVNHGIHLNNVTGTINSTTTNIIYSQAPAAILIENIPVAPNSLIPKFGALTIQSLFDNTEATNISLPGVNTGIAQKIYTPPLTIVFP